MKITDNYVPSHHYTNNYEKTEYFCPYCGVQSVYVEDGDGDYYQGPLHQCSNVECCHAFSLSGEHSGPMEQARARQLSTGVIDEPIAKRGG